MRKRELRLHRAKYTPAAATPGQEDAPLWDAGPLGEKLTPKEQLFVREYAIDCNASAAARRAHYGGTKDHGCKLMRKPHIRAAVAAMMDERARRVGVRADAVLEEIARLAFASIADVIEWGERADANGVIERDVWLRDRDAAPEAVWRGVQEVRFARGAIYVRMADKLTALTLLCKHLGLVGPAAARGDGAEGAEEAETAATLADDLEALLPETREKIRALLIEDHQAKLALRGPAGGGA